jgi:hypothetical protein
MFAAVAVSSAVFARSHNADAELLGNGDIVVTFSRSAADCAYSATLARVFTMSEPDATKITVATQGTGVRVRTYDEDGPQTSDFHLVVVCED